MCTMMFDIMESRLQPVQLEALHDLRAQIGDLGPVDQPPPDRADGRPLGQNELRPLPQRRAGIAIDSDVIDAVDLYAGLAEAVLDGQRREAGPVLDAAKAL